MHDPSTLAFEIKSPFKRKSSLFPKGYRKALVSIWHVDPCKDGSDDSCGWFKRHRHGNPQHYEKIKKEFDCDWDKTGESDDKSTTYYWGWFWPPSVSPNGDPAYSPMSIALGFFWRAALIHFDDNFEKAEKFMTRHLYRILSFAENPHDSMIDTIRNKYNSKREARITSMASMIYGCILRWDQKWWQHPRWHFWHWKIQVHFIDALKRFLFTRCCKCGRGFSWNACPISNQWDSTGPLWFRSEQGLMHDECSGVSVACAEPSSSP